MSPAKPVKKRIRGPLEKEGIRKKAKEAGPKAAKPHDFTVARESNARTAPFANAVYTASAHVPREMPPPGVPEIAFAGRSNAGKSSAINALAGRRRLAFVSKTPGRTQLVNFFSLGGARYLVDLPGYGYAGVPGAVREHWKDLVGTYIAQRPSLAGVVVMMDVRHPLTTLDRTLLEWLREAGRPAHVLLTKADKLSRQAASAALARVRRELGEVSPGTTVQLFSSLKAEGLEEAASAIDRLAAGKNKAPPKGE